MIADWLREHRVGSQEEVVARLSLAGVAATQATVSRDLDELGAVKLEARRIDPLRHARPGRARPCRGQARPAARRMGRRDHPGGQFAGAQDPARLGQPRRQCARRAGVEEVAGTIAGDDTIFVALADGANRIRSRPMLQRARTGA
jgi:transcriptional regulator of arginine metabolism